MDREWDDDERSSKSVRFHTSNKPVSQVSREYVPLVTRDYNIFKKIQDDRPSYYDEIEFVDYAYEKHAPPTITEEVEVTDGQEESETQGPAQIDECDPCYELITKNKFMYT